MCKRGCMSNYPYSTVHGKVYAFSKVGTARNVSIIASANPHGVNIYNSWNNSHTIVNNAVVYTAMRKYFLDMTKDNVNHSYGNQFKSPGGVTATGIITSGKYQISFFPRRPARIAYLDVLNKRLLPDREEHGQQGSHGGPDGHVGLHQPADGCGRSGSGRCTTPAARSTSR